MRGFTLIEVLIAISLLIMMLAVLVGFFVSAHSTYQFQTSVLEQDYHVRLLVKRVSEEVGAARAVVDSHAFPGGVRATSQQTLVVALPAIASEGEVIDGYLDYLTIYKEGSTVYQEIDAAPTSTRVSGQSTIASDIDELSFTYDSAPASEVRAVTISAVARAMVKQEDVQGQIIQTIYLRNAP